MCDCDCELPKAKKWDRIRTIHGCDIAYRIRAELVCCDIYDRIQREMAHDDDFHPIVSAVLDGSWHDLCYWGEAAAKIAEEHG